MSGEVIKADMTRLAGFPDGFRHLAYLQTESGMTVKTNMPGRIGPELDALYGRGAAWLAGAGGHPSDAGFGQTPLEFTNVAGFPLIRDDCGPNRSTAR